MKNVRCVMQVVNTANSQTGMCRLGFASPSEKCTTDCHRLHTWNWAAYNTNKTAFCVRVKRINTGVTAYSNASR